MILAAYLVFCLFCLFTYCLATKKGDKQNVVVGEFAVFVVLSIVPILNLMAMIFCLIYTSHQTGLWDKKLF